MSCDVIALSAGYEQIDERRAAMRLDQTQRRTSIDGGKAQVKPAPASPNHQAANPRGYET